MKKLTKDIFIKRVKEIHDNKYDYSKVEYKNNTTKVCIICPEHGEFWQTPKQHLNGQGCPKCGLKKIGDLFRKTREQFIQEAINLYGSRFIYDKVDYKNKDTKVCIICPKHGDFYITPRNFLNGHSCPMCYNERRNATTRFTTEKFIERAKKVHGDKYKYNKVVYKNAHAKVCIICPEHGEFWQIPNDHLMGHGCPKCANQESKGEMELFNILNNKTKLSFKQRTKEIIKPYEIDIYEEQTKIGIEYDGMVWHSVHFNTKYNLLEKTRLCGKNGVKLIHILENQWVYKKRIVISKLSRLFKIKDFYKEVTNENFLIRKDIPKNQIETFITENSLFDVKQTKFNLCLMNKKHEIYACLSLKKYKAQWKIVSYTENINYLIENSFEMLLAYFQNNYEYQSITVNVNRLWITDIEKYVKSGFKFVRNIKPQRYFINGAHKMLKTVDNTQKYYEFYDCGYVVLKLESNNIEDKMTDYIIDNDIESGHIFSLEELS